MTTLRHIHPDTDHDHDYDTNLHDLPFGSYVVTDIFWHGPFVNADEARTVARHQHGLRAELVVTVQPATP